MSLVEQRCWRSISQIWPVDPWIGYCSLVWRVLSRARRRVEGTATAFS